MESSHALALYHEVKHELAQVNSRIKVLRDTRKSLLRERTNLERVLGGREFLHMAGQQLRLPEWDEPPRKETKIPPRERVLHVQVMEDMLREFGPMHVKDIVRIASLRGVPFKGKKPPCELARDKLNNSKRFYLLGGNWWGLPQHALHKVTYLDDYRVAHPSALMASSGHQAY